MATRAKQTIRVDYRDDQWVREIPVSARRGVTLDVLQAEADSLYEKMTRHGLTEREMDRLEYLSGVLSRTRES